MTTKTTATTHYVVAAVPKSATPHSVPTTTHRRHSWYAAGGMDINLVGMVINIAVPVVLLVRQGLITVEHGPAAFVTVLLVLFTCASLTCQTTYCILVVPTYFLSLGLALTLDSNPLLLLAASLMLASVKINIFMSALLHRYAAHAAFKCGPVTNVGLCLAACLANQGGPLWWATQHRCHHKLRVLLCLCVCVFDSRVISTRRFLVMHVNLERGSH